MTAAAPASRAADLAISLLLGVLAVGVVVATNDMGFVRDEAFYFGHAETYQDWQVRVEAGGERRREALTRKEILATWHNNSEHPPLDKWLFGWSWRGLGRKLRPIDRVYAGPQGTVRLDIGGLGPAHGFAVGSQVSLLHPQVVGQSPSPKGRGWLQGRVVERREHSAVLQLDGRAPLSAVQQGCPQAGPQLQAGAAAGAADEAPMRILRTGCEALEQRRLYVMSESDAMRFPGALFAGLLVALTYLAARMVLASQPTFDGPQALRRPFAVLAAVGFLAIPQAFWHAHLCTFDMTIAALLFATTWLWHRGLTSKLAAWLAAVVWGLALLAKHNALFLPVPLIVVWLWDALAGGRVQWRWARPPRVRWAVAGGAVAVAALVAAAIHPAAGLGVALAMLAAGGLDLRLPAVPLVFVLMLLIGPLVLVAGWPLLWVDTFDNLLRWIEFHLHHEHYMQVWFGQVLQNPPFPAIFPWGMTVLTWPLSLLASTVVGLLAVYGPQTWLPRRRTADNRTAEQRSWDRVVLLSALWPMALISMPGTPIFGGTKHWMPAFPFLLLVGARGVQAVWDQLSAGWRERAPRRAAAFAWSLALLLLAPAVVATADTYRHGAAYFNEGVGGIRGAAQAGMQRNFWGGSTRDGLETVNRLAPHGASIWFHKCAWGAFVMYQREGWFRRDLRYSGSPEGTALGFFHHQKDHDDFELELMRNYDWRTPVAQSAFDGAPILSVYQRPPPPAPAATLPPRSPLAPVAPQPSGPTTVRPPPQRLDLLRPSPERAPHGPQR